MKLILTQEVAGLGGPGDVVEVKDGYGRNYLMPRGAAIRWTRGGEKQVTSIQRGREVREVRDLGQAGRDQGRAREPVASSSRSAPATAGRLFGSVTVADIVEAVTKAGGPQVDKRRIEIGQPIKTVGAHQVTVRLHPEVTATVSVEVVPRLTAASDAVRRARTPDGSPGLALRPPRRAPRSSGRTVGLPPVPHGCGSLSASGSVGSSVMTRGPHLTSSARRPRTSRRSGRPSRSCSSTTGRPCCGSAPA